VASTLLERTFTPCAAHADEWDKLKGLDGSFGTNLRWQYAADHSSNCPYCNECTLSAAEEYAVSQVRRREPAVRRKWWYEQEGYCMANIRDEHGRRRYHGPGYNNDGKRADCPDCWTAMLERWQEAAVDASRRLS